MEPGEDRRRLEKKKSSRELSARNKASIAAHRTIRLVERIPRGVNASRFAYPSPEVMESRRAPPK